MLLDGLKLTFVGISIVFSFLIIMVLIITWMSKLVLKYFPEKTTTASNEAKTEDGALVAAITAAVKPLTR